MFSFFFISFFDIRSKATKSVRLESNNNKKMNEKLTVGTCHLPMIKRLFYTAYYRLSQVFSINKRQQQTTEKK